MIKKKTISESLKMVFFTIALVWAAIVFSTGSVRAEGDVPEIDTSIRDPFEFNYFAIPDGATETYGNYSEFDFNDKLDMPSKSDVKYSVFDSNATVDALRIKGKMKDIEGDSITFKKEFEFGTGTVNRVRIDAVTEVGKKVYVQLWKDDDTEPFITKAIANAKSSDYIDCISPVFVEIPAEASLTKNRIKITFTNGSDNKTLDGEKYEILLRSIKFYKPSVPTVYVNIDESLGTISAMNSDQSHSTNCYGDITIKVPNDYVSPYLNEASDYNGGVYPMEYIRGRGNSTWNADKKPYKFKLYKDENLFGMGENKHWALIANFYDQTLIRNRITYYLGSLMGMEYTPKLIPVDVVMNDVYLGSYYLSEVVRIDDNRVEIDNLEKDPSDLSGGYLIGMSPYGKEDGYQFHTRKNVPFVLESPEEIDGDEDGEMLSKANAYIEDYMNKVEDCIFGENFENSNGESYKDYMDIESAAKYFLIQSFTLNGDAYITPSTKLYKKRNGKLYWGPLWDFDYVAWNYERDFYDKNMAEGSEEDGSQGEDENDGDDEFEEETKEPSFVGTGYVMKWFVRLLEDPDFVKAVNDAWYGSFNNPQEGLRYQLNEIVRSGGKMDQYVEDILESAEANYDVIGSSNTMLSNYNINLEDEDGTQAVYAKEILRYNNKESYLKEVDFQKQWILARVGWVDENISKLSSYVETETVPVVNFYDGEELIDSITLESGMRLSSAPEVSREGYVFAGWYFDNGYDGVVDMRILNLDDCIYDSRDYHAEWIKEDEYKPTEKIVLTSDEVYLEAGDNVGIGYTVLPEENADRGLIFGSSSPNTIWIESNGVINTSDATEPGDYELTITTFDGYQAKITVHVLDMYTGIPSTDYILDKEKIELKVGETDIIGVRFEPEQSTCKGIKFVSGNTDVIEVTDSGIVKAVGKGSADIIVTCVDISEKKRIKVTVTDDADEEQGGDKTDDKKDGEGESGGKQESPEAKQITLLKKGDTFTSGNLTYEVTKPCTLQEGKASGGTVRLTGFVYTVKNKKKALSVPDTVTFGENTFSVTAVKAWAFKNCKKLTKVTVGANVTSVGKNAFYGCKKLKKVIFTGKTCKFGKAAFKKTYKNIKFKVPADSLAKYRKALKKIGISKKKVTK